MREPWPYGSYGNGSAMRVSAAGWLYDTLEETRRIARLTAVVTHNHPEGIKGAEATASAIFLARTGAGKDEIKDYIISEFGYDLSRSCDEIRPTYHHVESCQKTVPEAITAFLEGTDFEDVIRTAVSLGGDCDTLTCIACSIGEAFFGIPGEMVSECRKRLPDDMLAVLDRFAEQTKPAFHPNVLVNDDMDSITAFSSHPSFFFVNSEGVVVSPAFTGAVPVFDKFMPELNKLLVLLLNSFVTKQLCLIVKKSLDLIQG